MTNKYNLKKQHDCSCSFLSAGRLSVEKFVQLLVNPRTDIWLLQAYAHKLLEKGEDYKYINSACFEYFEVVRLRQKRKELRRAEKIALALPEEPFYWHCWMGLESEEQPIKSMEENRYHERY